MGNKVERIVGSEQSGSGQVVGKRGLSGNGLILIGHGRHGCPGAHDQHLPCESVNWNESCCANPDAMKQPRTAVTVKFPRLFQIHSNLHKFILHKIFFIFFFLLFLAFHCLTVITGRNKTALISKLGKCRSYICSTYLEMWKLSLTTKINHD